MVVGLGSQVKVALQNVPEAIKPLRRWVIWSWGYRGGKRTKVPLIAEEPDDCFGWQLASSTGPRTWRRYESAAFVALHYDEVAGIGFVLGDGWSGVDQDECRDPTSGDIDRWATDVVNALRSYTEISPSLTGLKTLVKGVKPDGRCKKGRVEIYSSGRYFTLTGRHLPGTPHSIEDRQEELAALHGRLFPVRERPQVFSAKALADTPAVALGCPPPEQTDKMKTLLAKSASAPVGSRSEADFAFCCEAVLTGMHPDEGYRLCGGVGKFAQGGRRYFDRTWGAAARKVASELAELRRLKETYPGVFD
jgi:primase-polymerase (primpol)-like protein